MRNNNQLVMMEWYDGYIPPRHHMAVVSIDDAQRMVRHGWPIYVHFIDLEMLDDERATTQRHSR